MSAPTGVLSKELGPTGPAGVALYVVSVSRDDCNRSLQTLPLKITGIYSLMFLTVRSLKQVVRIGSFWRPWGRISFLAFLSIKKLFFEKTMQVKQTLELRAAGSLPENCMWGGRQEALTG